MINYIHAKLIKFWSVVKQNKAKAMIYVAISAIVIQLTSPVSGLYFLLGCIIFDLTLSKFFLSKLWYWLIKYSQRKPVDFYDELVNAHKKAYEDQVNQVNQANNIEKTLPIPLPLIRLIQEYNRAALC